MGDIIYFIKRSSARARPRPTNKALICPEFIAKLRHRNNTREESEFYERLIEEIVNRAPFRMNLNEYILYIKDHLYVPDYEISEAARTKKSSSKTTGSNRFKPSQGLESSVDFGRDSETLTPLKTDERIHEKIEERIEEKTEQRSIHTPIQEQNFKQIYQGGYRDVDQEILYRLVCGLAQTENSEFDGDDGRYETIKILLHNISLKNRQPKEFTYEASELFPDLGGEWMSYNETEIENALKSRLGRLTGHIDIDFTKTDAIIKGTGSPKSDYNEGELVFLNMNEKPSEKKDFSEVLKSFDKDMEEQKKAKLMKKVTFQEKTKGPKFNLNKNKANKIDELSSESYEGSEESEEIEFIRGEGIAGFKEFKPNAILTDEDLRVKEKVRDAGYKVPKYDIIKDYKNMQSHFLDDEGLKFEENK